MKTNLIITVVMLAVGIGVGRAFSQGEDTKSHVLAAQPHVAKSAPATVETPAAKDQAPQSPAVPQPQPTESAVAAASATKRQLAPSQSDSFFNLLYPHQRDTRENPLTEDGILILYDQLQSELKGSNSNAIDRHAELRKALAKYVQARAKAKSETVGLNSSDEPSR